jgi:hypothetical protein
MDRRLVLGVIAAAPLLTSAIALRVGHWLLAMVLLGAFVVWSIQMGGARR